MSHSRGSHSPRQKLRSAPQIWSGIKKVGGWGGSSNVPQTLYDLVLFGFKAFDLWPCTTIHDITILLSYSEITVKLSSHCRYS